MPGQIITGPAGSGKTQSLIEHLLAAEGASFGREMWVLLPNRRQMEAFRERLMAAAPGQTLFDVRFFDVYELYDLLLDLHGSPQRILGPAAQERVLIQSIKSLDSAGALGYYQRIAHTGGFMALVKEWLRELKQGLIPPEAFQAQASSPKDHDLALIYSHYQAFLQQHHLVDRDGAGWVALEALQSDPGLVGRVKLLAVDGFDNFTPLQAALLGQLAALIPQTYLALSYEAERRGPAFAPLARTLARLQRYAPHEPWAQADLGPQEAAAGPLAYLRANLFADEARPQDLGGAVQFIQAPDPLGEVQAVLRQVKALLVAGRPAGDILICYRQSETYGPLLRSVGRAYGLPLLVSPQEAAADTPALQALISLLDLASADFPRRDWLDFLRNPYFQVPGFTLAEVAALEALSAERIIVGGREHWLSALRSSARLRDEEGEIRERPPIIVDPQALGALFDRLTPPPQARPRAYVAWLEGLLGPDGAVYAEEGQEAPSSDHLNFYAQVRIGTRAEWLTRDLAALQAWRSALAELLAAYDLLALTGGGGEAEITWEDFRADLGLILGRLRLSIQPARSQRVLALNVFEARGLPHPIIFLLGLSEGGFPAPSTEDPLYSDAERLAMEAAGLDVETAEDRNREAALFYQLISLAQEGLILSRPTLDGKGNEWPASHFWAAAHKLCQHPPLTELELAHVPALNEAASLREYALALTQAIKEGGPAWEGALAALRAERPWANVERGRAIEMRRLAGLADPYNGVLWDAELLAQVAAYLGPRRLWSATQFNELATCRFRFFSHRLLALEAYKEPEPGLDQLQLGELNHKILELTYAQIQRENLSLQAANQARALEILDQVAQEVLAEAPQAFGFQATAYWQQEQARLLEKLAEVVAADFSPDSPVIKKTEAEAERHIYALEMPFGQDGAPPLRLAEGLLARGMIDRIDQTPHGLVLMDYKTGSSTPSNKDLEEGRNFQMLLYLLALKQARPDRPIQGFFWSLATNKGQAQISAGDEKLGPALEILLDLVAAARAGDFHSHPPKLEERKCSRYCDYSQLCRVANKSR